MSKKKITPVKVEDVEAKTIKPSLTVYTIPSLGISVEAENAQDAVVKANKKVKEQ
jgi:hypothetical protein